MTICPTAVHPPRRHSISITPAERVGRVAVGLAGIIVGLVLIAGAGSALAVVLEVLLTVAGLDLLVTGALGHCPLYAELGHVPQVLTDPAMSAHDPQHHAPDPSQSPDRRKEDVRPARSEEREVAEKSGDQWTAYAAGHARVPAEAVPQGAARPEAGHPRHPQGRVRVRLASHAEVTWPWTPSPGL
ncbi:DUF2892 domain-containing protein [Streptomyces sp. NPDC005989]|uniref:YgaP family membrane protein n=1 Tax=Streptomyces sp. NPDC005989 TaxID=3156727 RepID=UPI0033C7A076